MDYATDEYTITVPYPTITSVPASSARKYPCPFCGRGSAPPGADCPTCGTTNPTGKGFYWPKDFRGYMDGADMDDTPVPTMN